MSRSQRRAAVVRRSIAAGLLCTGFGMAVAAPAVADPDRHDHPSDSSNHARGVNGVEIGVPEDHGHGPPDHKPDGNPDWHPPGGNPDWHPPDGHSPGGTPDWHPPDWHPNPDDPCPPCPIPPCPPRPVPPAPVVNPGWIVGRRNIFFPPAPLVRVPLSVLAAGIDPTAGRASLALDVAEAPPKAAPAAAGPAQASAGGWSGPAASGAAAPAVLPDVPASPPPLRQPETVVAAPNPPRSGLPGVPSANLGQIAALALPGLVGIAALTALGGFVGYRQAKAGYVLRAAGTARFLQ